MRFWRLWRLWYEPMGGFGHLVCMQPISPYSKIRSVSCSIVSTVRYSSSEADIVHAFGIQATLGERSKRSLAILPQSFVPSSESEPVINAR